jgi:HD domain
MATKILITGLLMMLAFVPFREAQTTALPTALPTALNLGTISATDLATGNARAQAIAAQSRPARVSLQFINQQVGTLAAPLRRRITHFLANPAATYQQLAATLTEQQQVLSTLQEAQLVPADTTLAGIYPPVADAQQAPQSFLAAPGSYYRSPTAAAGHHAYPGGLAIHTAFNLRAALALTEQYQKHYSRPQQPYRLNRDTIIAAVVLHDIMKTLVFQWQNDGSQLPEQRIADTGAHHILGLAELLARRFPVEIVVATAAAHNPPRPGELRQKVVRYLRAAAIIARVDPVAYGLLQPTGNDWDITLPAQAEHFIVHLSDADYFYSELAATATVEYLQQWLQKQPDWMPEDLQGTRFNWLRNYFLSQNTGIGSYQLLLQQPQLLKKILKKALVAEKISAF